MNHTTIFKHKDYYASFPLLQRMDSKLIIGYFKAPMVDHMGVFEWIAMESTNEGKTWGYPFREIPYDWPAVSARERSDRFTTTLPDGTEIATGSYGFKQPFGVRTRHPFERIKKSNYLFLRSSPDGWKTIEERTWEIPNADVVLAFPRQLQAGELILVPVYVVSKLQFSRCLAWRSEDWGESWKLYNMFPIEVNGNEMAFILTEKGILAHIRSDTNPYIMESWSEDYGKTWTYPVNIHMNVHSQERAINNRNVAGGPSHLLRLNDGRILCTYGYRFGKMGIRAIISEDEGKTWEHHIVLREDGGYLSSLHKRSWAYRFRLPNPGNDVGYPTSIELSDGVILTAYYFTGSDKITCVAATNWSLK